MNFWRKLFGGGPQKASPVAGQHETAPKDPISSLSPAGRDIFPGHMLGAVAMIIINYEGDKDSDLQRAVVDRLMPLARSGTGFKTYSNAIVPSLALGGPVCGMIRFQKGLPEPFEGMPEEGVSLDSYTAYLASKDSFPSGAQREFEASRIGYWIGTERGRKVHAILLLA